MRKFTFALLVLLFAGMSYAFAQERTISGTVQSTDGSKLPGVTIQVKGTTRGTITDTHGKYTIMVGPNDKVLIFSFVGMQKQEVAIGTSNTINVVLRPTAQALNQVIVVGYGTATKQSFTGSVKTVSSANIESKDVSNVSQSLAGEAAGVQVINTSGQPGSVATIRIRGYGSVNGSRDPMYVLDGVPFSGSLNSINPDDIASITILKDAMATAIYGSRGANGVILITTKKGKAGTSKIEVTAKTGVNFRALPDYSVIKSPETYIGLSWESMYNAGVEAGASDPVAYANENLFSGIGIDSKYNMWNVSDVSALIDPTTHKVRSGVTRLYNPENWYNYAFQKSSRQEFNITFRGGNAKTSYFTSFGLLNDRGYSVNSNFQRYNAMISLQHQAKKWLKVSSTMNFSRTKSNNNGQGSSSNSIFWFVDNIPPIYPLFLRNSDGSKVKDPVYGGYQYDYGVGRGFGALTNAIADAHYNLNRTINYEITGNFNANITFTKGLTLENKLGTDYRESKFDNLINPFYGSAATQGGYLYKDYSQMVNYDFLNLLRFKRSFGGGNHNVEAMIAHEANYWQNKDLTAQMSKLVDPNIAELDNFVIVSAPPTSYADNVRLESYFGELNYNYKNTYYFSAAVRRDGSSRFLPKNRWGTFGSAGVSWIMSNAGFMQNLSFVKFLKLKASYGTIGDQQGIGYYPAYNTFSVSNLNDQISISAYGYGNPNLTWERSTMFQAGLEFDLGKVLHGSIDYYMKNTSDLLFNRRVGPSVGYAYLQVNDGILRNRGVEFDITTHIINRKNYGLDFEVNGAFLTDKLTKMPIDPATGKPKIIDVEGYYGWGKGHSIFDFYMRQWAGVNPNNGEPMWYEYYYDANGNGKLDSGEGIASLSEYEHEYPKRKISKTTTSVYANATQKYIGKSAIPVLRGAFRLDGRVKNFNISAQFLYSLGGYGYDFQYASLMGNGVIGSNNWSTDIMARWQKPGDKTNVPKLDNHTTTNVNSTSSRFVTRSDYLLLNNIRIGYTPSRKFTDRIGFRFHLYLTGDNLFLSSARKGYNPQTTEDAASDWYQYPPFSTYTFGIRVDL